jgi:hypothetical protein
MSGPEQLLLDRPPELEPQPVWQSDAALVEVEPRMAAMEQRVRMYEMPLLNALEIEYGDKIAKHGWLLCGPSSIVLSRLINEDTGIPIVPFNQDRHRECLQLQMYVFNPYDKPELPPRIDHTNMQYRTGRGFSMTIDPAYQLLWGGARKEPGAILVERHYDHLQDNDMGIYNLITMSNYLISHKPQDGWPGVWATDGEPNSYLDSVEMLEAMHGPEVFDDLILTQSGRVYDVSANWGKRLIRVYDAVRQEVPRTQPLLLPN